MSRGRRKRPSPRYGASNNVNKLPRLPGQGVAHRAKVITGISGSHTGGTSVQRWSMGEFNGGSFSSWPNALPASGSQTGYDVIVPYKFFGLPIYGWPAAQ